MFLRPHRTRAGLAFLGGLSVSLLVLTGGFLFLQSQREQVMEQLSEQARLAVEAEFAEAHPTEPVYVFTRDMRAGEVLQEHDLSLSDMPAALVPADAVRDLEAARGLVVRGAVRANTLCADALLYGQQEYPDDARIQEFTSIRLPSRLAENQSIDVRITFPNGLDYVVLAKKEVKSLESAEAGASQRVWLTVNEEEILRVSSAIVDAYLHPGTVLYALTYVAPDIQQAAVCTYPANAYVQDLIRQNPNILSHAITELDRTNREWFDAIPDPQPNQPLAIVPAPEGGTLLPGSGTDQSKEGTQALPGGTQYSTGGTQAPQGGTQASGEGTQTPQGGAQPLGDGTQAGEGESPSPVGGAGSPADNADARKVDPQALPAQPNSATLLQEGL